MRRFNFIGLALSAALMLGCSDPADDVDPVDAETGMIEEGPVGTDLDDDGIEPEVDPELGADIDDDGLEGEVDPELGAEEGAANEPPADPAVDEEPATELPETPAEP